MFFFIFMRHETHLSIIPQRTSHTQTLMIRLTAVFNNIKTNKRNFILRLVGKIMRMKELYAWMTRRLILYTFYNYQSTIIALQSLNCHSFVPFFFRAFQIYWRYFVLLFMGDPFIFFVHSFNNIVHCFCVQPSCS